MSTEENRVVVRRAFDSMSAGPDAFVAEHDEIYSADLVGHFSGMPPVDINMHRQFGLGTFSAFPDLKRPVEDLVAEGDKVVARWTSVGTHSGDFMGISPTGRQVTTSGITIFRLEGGKIVEEWSESDMLGMLQQVGAFPGPGG
jgi:predicted ester cyclase